VFFGEVGEFSMVFISFVDFVAVFGEFIAVGFLEVVEAGAFGEFGEGEGGLGVLLIGDGHDYLYI